MQLELRWRAQIRLLGVILETAVQDKGQLVEDIIEVIVKEGMLPCVWLNAWLTNRVVWAQGTYVATSKSDPSRTPLLGSLGADRRNSKL